MDDLDPLQGTLDAIYRRGDIPLPNAIRDECQRRGVPYHGDLSLHLMPFNIMLVGNISQEACDIGEEIRHHPLLTIEGSDVWVYAYECAPIIELPLAKKLPKGGYKTPHWCPVVVVPAVEMFD